MDPFTKRKPDADYMIYAIGHHADGTYVLACGITTEGMTIMEEDAQTLTVDIPAHLQHISRVVLFHGPTAVDVRARFEESGLPVTETDLNKVQ